MRFCFCRNGCIDKHTSSRKRAYESQYWLGQQPELFLSNISFGNLGQYQWISFIFFLALFGRWELLLCHVVLKGNTKECKNLKCKIQKAVVFCSNYVFLCLSNSYLPCKKDQKISVETDVSCNQFVFRFIFNFIRCNFAFSYFA